MIQVRKKAYDRVDRRAMWEMLQMCGIGNPLLKVLKSFMQEVRFRLRYIEETGTSNQ